MGSIKGRVIFVITFAEFWESDQTLALSKKRADGETGMNESFSVFGKKC